MMKRNIQDIPEAAPPKILGTGLIALDIVLDSNKQLLSYGLGGSAGNVLSILASLGWSSSPIGKLGCDVAAEIILEEFRRLNANLQLIVQEHSIPTPVVYQHQLDWESGKTHKFSFACPVCGVKRSWHAPNIDLPPPEVLDAVQPNVVYMDRATALGVQVAEYYKSRDVMVFFEPSEVGTDPELFRQALAVADVVKYADDRLEDLEAFDRSHVFVEICTKGSAGLRFRAPSLGADWVNLDAYTAPNIIDTSGAGDWCTSGLLYYLFKKDPDCSIARVTYNRLNEALRFGQALSALNCMAMGARGLAKALHRKKINQLAEDLQQTKLESGSAGTEADNILREGWSKLISSHLNPKAINRSSRDCRICHTEL
jgi:fructokinase